MKTQQQIWNEEHETPTVLHQMNADTPSSGVVLFVEWMNKHGRGMTGQRGIEMGCGKGRNGIYLAGQGAQMDSFDFSSVAIAEAERRREQAGVSGVHFFVQDATKRWPFEDATFDFGMDVFASTDIDSEQGRDFARSEFFRVLKPEGLLFIYLLSTDDAFHADMIQKHAVGDQRNAFRHPQTGKFEKAYDREELVEAYRDFEIVEERRIEKTATFFGKEYPCKHFWIIFQKPVA